MDQQGNPDNNWFAAFVVIQTPDGRFFADTNGDGRVGLGDEIPIMQNLGKKGLGLKGDLNGDGWVDVADLVIWGRRFGERR